MWILGSFYLDALFLILPAVVSLSLLLFGMAQNSTFYIILGTVIIDSGHVYTTIWRTLLHAEERKSSLMYIFVPIGVAVFFFTWAALSLPYLWSFVLYATIHHNIRQFYGVTRWYQSLNRRYSPWNTFFFYALTILPFIAFHFRPEAITGFYTPHDLVLWPNANVFLWLVRLYAIGLLAWVIYEVSLRAKGLHEFNRVTSMLTAFATYGITFYFGQSSMQILLPLVLTHGIAYFGLISLALQRTRKSAFSYWPKALVIVLGTAIFCGWLESYIEGHWIRFESIQISLLEALIIGLYLIPLFSHFIFDAFIWRKGHREGQLIYPPQPTRAQ